MSSVGTQQSLPFKARAGQRAFRQDISEHRVCGLVCRRQYGKTTLAGVLSLDWMRKFAGITVIFGSVKLTLGREIVRAEAEVLHKTSMYLSAVAEAANMKLETMEDDGGGNIKRRIDLNPDDFAELFEAQRLEFRLYHSRSTYSRTKIIALTPDAVGETGYLITDEVGRCKQFREVCEAVEWIISANPQYRWILTTTPPPDDNHYSFDMLAPPPGTDLPVRPEGNLYKSDTGIWVRMVTAYDAFADGVPLYDSDSGDPITPEESRHRAHDKDAWDRNGGCKFKLGGSSACGIIQLHTAQTRGIGHCQFFDVTDDLEFDQALTRVLELLGNGPVGLGFDVATTTKQTSNPSSFAFVEKHGVEFIVRAVLNWKTWDPAVAEERIEKCVRLVRARKAGGPARKLRVDATNEKYWCQGLRRKLAGLLPVELIIASETIEVRSEPEPLTLKQYEGSVLVDELDDNHLWLPPEKYLRDDFRLVKKEKGQFVCEPDPATGMHGDTFDSVKKGILALIDDGPARADRIVDQGDDNYGGTFGDVRRRRDEEHARQSSGETF